MAEIFFSCYLNIVLIVLALRTMPNGILKTRKKCRLKEMKRQKREREEEKEEGGAKMGEEREERSDRSK